MTHHDGTDHDHEAHDGSNDKIAHASHTESEEGKVADYVGPVDHGDDDSATSASSKTTSTEEEHGDYVNPVDHGE